MRGVLKGMLGDSTMAQIREGTCDFALEFALFTMVQKHTRFW